MYQQKFTIMLIILYKSIEQKLDARCFRAYPLYEEKSG